MIEFAALRAQIYNYLTGNNNEDKKAKDNNNKYKAAKGTKKCVIKQKPKFEDYENCLQANKF